ncbi:predicted protein [Sclerotinia sclerotiorum 1980 UF-70]|uniref:Uncharacterized protein n=1 Tax=Sclerotinia sclerotiorum (strain ATCC 18683 / 1980 / Ss-1) TaxID=665079 RepID=A7F2Z9_SCLS1|nr:predicted protein [Sclerotinia sclerotiorum 1980 UF-70]EDN96091.1 predicted protein [Sclerotinia sclerotiorum 1980 UF-70]
MIDLEHEALHKGNHPDYIDLRPSLDLLDPESLWTFDSYGPTIRMDLRFVSLNMQGLSCDLDQTICPSLLRRSREEVVIQFC